MHAGPQRGGAGAGRTELTELRTGCRIVATYLRGRPEGVQPDGRIPRGAGTETGTGRTQGVL